jgi:type 1 glutamine amidotransferase
MVRAAFSTPALGTSPESWDDPSLQRMYAEAIKWALGLISADATPQPMKQH